MMNRLLAGFLLISHPYPEKREAPWEPKWEEDWEYTPTRQGTFFKQEMSGK